LCFPLLGLGPSEMELPKVSKKHVYDDNFTIECATAATMDIDICKEVFDNQILEK